jgi:ADP-ribose pyrophosphatase
MSLQTHRLPNGELSDREVIEHPGAVCLVPMVDEDHVCLVRVYRFATGQSLVEVPAGTLDPGEHPDVTAARELREETGYSAAKIRKLAEWWVSPGILTERMHLYVCEGLTLGKTNLQPDESIETTLVPWDEAMAMTLDGRIEDAKTLASLLIYDRLRDVIS